MKNWGAVVVVLVGLMLGGCFNEKEDKTKPVISLKGNAVEEISAGISYVDAGVMAIDNADGDISANVSMELYLGDEKVEAIDVTTSGAYTIKYNVTDKAGNKASEVVRSVRMKGDENNETTSIAASVQASAGMGITVTANSTAVQYKEFEVQGTVSGSIPKVKVLIDNLYRIPYNRLVTVVNGTYSLKFRFSSSGVRKITVIGCTNSGEEINGIKKEQNITVNTAGTTGIITIDKSITTVNKNEMFKITGTLSTNIKKVFITADDIFYLHPENDYVSISNAGTANARYTYYRPFDEAGTRKINVWGCDTNGNVIAVSEQFLLTVSASENKNGISVLFSPATGITTNTNVNISVTLPSNISGISRIKLLADNKYLFSDERVISNPHKANRIFDTASDDKIIHAYGFDISGNVMIASPAYHLIVTKGTTVEPTPPTDNGNSQFESPLRSVKYYIGEAFKLRVKVKPDTKKGVVLAYYCPQNNGVYKEKNFDQNFPFFNSNCKNGYYEEQVSLRENRDEGYYIFVLKEYTDDTNYEITDSLVSLYFEKRKTLPIPTINLTSPLSKSVYKKGDNLKVTATGTNNDHIAVLMEKVNTEDEAISNSQDWLGGLQKGNSYAKDKILANVGKYRITATGRNTANETDIGSIKVSSSAIEIEVGIPATSKYGDVDGNGIVSENDAKILLEYVVGKRVLTDSQKNAAEVTGDGKITAGDATQVRRYIKGEITQFSVEAPVKINDVGTTPFEIGENFTLSGTVLSIVKTVKITIDDKYPMHDGLLSVVDGKLSCTKEITTDGIRRFKVEAFSDSKGSIKIGEDVKTITFVKRAVPNVKITQPKYYLYFEGDTINLSFSVSGTKYVRIRINNGVGKDEIIKEEGYEIYKNGIMTVPVKISKIGAKVTISVDCRNTKQSGKNESQTASSSVTIESRGILGTYTNGSMKTSLQELRDGFTNIGLNPDGQVDYEKYSGYTYLDLFRQKPGFKLGNDDPRIDLLNRIYTALGVDMLIRGDSNSTLKDKTPAMKDTKFDALTKSAKNMFLRFKDGKAILSDSIDNYTWTQLENLIREFGVTGNKDIKSFRDTAAANFKKYVPIPIVLISAPNTAYVGDKILFDITGKNSHHVAYEIWKDGIKISAKFNNGNANEAVGLEDSILKGEYTFTESGTYKIIGKGNLMTAGHALGKYGESTKDIIVTTEPKLSWGYFLSQGIPERIFNNESENFIFKTNVENCDEVIYEIYKNEKTVDQININVNANGEYKTAYKFKEFGKYKITAKGRQGNNIVNGGTIYVTVELRSRYKKIEMKDDGMYILVTHASNIGMLATKEGIDDDKYKNFTGVNGSYFKDNVIGSLNIFNPKTLTKMTVEDNKELYEGESGAVNDIPSPTLVYDKISDACTIQLVSSKDEIKVINKNQSWAIGGIASYVGQDTGNYALSGSYDEKNPTAFFRNFIYGAENKTFYAFDSNNNVYLIVYEEKTKNPAKDEFYKLGDFITKLENTIGVKIVNGIVSDGGGSSTMREQNNYTVYNSGGIGDSMRRRVPSMVYIKRSEAIIGF